MPERLLPATTAVPVWRRAGIRSLEEQLQARTADRLMDLAGWATARLALALAPHARTVWIVAGPGNNGGDGLEAAMHLHRWGLRVQVSLLARPLDGPRDARRAHERAQAAGVPIQQGLPASPPDLGAQDLCIDALLGMGATRPAQGEMLQAIDWLNSRAAPTLSIDLPSGLDADSGQTLGEAVVQADHTLTMLGAKPGLFMGRGRDVCGTLWCASLGLPAQACDWASPDARLNPPATPLQRHHASHKGSHGDLAVVGGESHGSGSGMAGAALLAAQAALSAGCGRVMLSLLGEAAPPMRWPPDLMQKDINALDLPRLTVVAGCGGGRAMAQPMARLLQHSARLVLDADAINRLAEDPWLAQGLLQRAQRRLDTLMTPHPLEAARLLGVSTTEVQADRLQAAQTLSQRWQCAVVLKGSGSVIAMPGQTPRINTTGNGRLAIGGTGDVLAGLAGARWSVLGDVWAAACDAVWTHGHVADHWPADLALTASRLADRLR